METGYKAFKASVMKSIQIEEHRFGVEPEILAETRSHSRFSPTAARRYATCSRATKLAKIALNFLGHARAAVPALSQTHAGPRARPRKRRPR